MYSIVQSPNQILRGQTNPVNLAPAKLKKIISEMIETLLAQDDPEGVGLAANQVGLPYRLFLARFTTKKNEPVRVFINPEITRHSEELQGEEKDAPLEGCLSLPKYYGIVKRWKWIELKYQNDKFEIKNEKFDGFAAVVIQHEMDHLNGKIFVEKILEQQGKLYKVTPRKPARNASHSDAGGDKKDKDQWEEVEI